jgi:hypothetical protein
MLVTLLLGIVMELNAEHPLNAVGPIYVIPAKFGMDPRELQF